jgi:hypothetical protein
MSIDLAIFLIVVGARFLIPLAIPRFPLPAVVAAMLLDAADQTIFQKFTNLQDTPEKVAGYQGYDKAMDIYYLVIAYLSTMRNWTNLTAFQASRFLIYYRLIGVAAYELTHVRALLLIFPNTFEYFFIWYESVASRWNPLRMAPKLVLGAMAAIWIFIKLPQEYWIHIAKLDTTEAIQAHPWSLAVIAVALVALLVATRWVLTHKVPKPDWKATFAVDARPGKVSPEQVAAARAGMKGGIFSAELGEKIVLMSLVSVIFGQIMPGLDITATQMAISIAILVVANTLISELLFRSGAPWVKGYRQAIAMVGVNIAGVLALEVVQRLVGRDSGEFRLGPALFFVLLLALMIAMYDRYRPIHLARRMDAAVVPVTGTDVATA